MTKICQKLQILGFKRCARMPLDAFQAKEL